MKTDELIAYWLSEEVQPFSGWDFSYITRRMHTDPLPWDYPQRAIELMSISSSTLDLDTGGGELILSLRKHWSLKLTVAEGYPPNFLLARQKLEPLGVRVVEADSADDAPLPFQEAEFDLVLNRHGGINCAEVGRILMPGGTFLTQQVHGRWAEDLTAVFGQSVPWPDSTPEKYLPRLKAVGLEIADCQEWQGKLSFTDVGAIVYYLKAIPWQVEGFSVQTHLDGLIRLQERHDQGGKLEFIAWQYFIEARKP